MLSGEDIAIQIGIGFFTAIIVGIIIRYRLKTKHEDIFEHNRNYNLGAIFAHIENFDFQFDGFIKIFEKRMGEFTAEKTKILPEPEMKMSANGENIIDISSSMGVRIKYDELKKDLAPFVDNMNNFHKQFRKDYHIFHNYVHDSFLRDVNMYFWESSYFSEWALKDSPLPQCLWKRMEYAKKIVNYVKLDKSIDDHNYFIINNFVQKWEKDFKKFDIINQQ